MKKLVLIYSAFLFLSCISDDESSNNSDKVIPSTIFKNSILYTVMGERGFNNAPFSELHLVQNGTVKTLFTSKPGYRSDGDISSDGSKIAYVKGVSPSSNIGAMMHYSDPIPYPTEIYISTDGEEEVVLTSSTMGYLMLPEFSPTGNYISYQALDTSSGNRSLIVINNAGEQIISMDFVDGVNSYWLNDSLLVIYGKGSSENMEYFIGNIYINRGMMETGGITSGASLSTMQPFRIPNTDTLIFATSNGGYILRHVSGNRTVSNDYYQGFSIYGDKMVYGMKNDSTLLINENTAYLSDNDGKILDSLSFEGFYKGSRIDYWGDHFYLISETGNDRFNLYRLSFETGEVKKLTNNYDNYFIVNVGHSLY